MNISLNHEEIEMALRQYVKSLGIDLSNKEIDITMVAGRGGNGYKAEISIESKLIVKRSVEPVQQLQEEEGVVEEVQEETVPQATTEAPKSLFAS